MNQSQTKTLKKKQSEWPVEEITHVETVLLNSGQFMSFAGPITWLHLTNSRYVTQSCMCAGYHFNWETLSDSDWNELFYQ